MNPSRAALLIGATSGIGRELALLLLAEGYQVGITGRRAPLLAELTALHPQAIKSATFDIAAAHGTEQLQQLTDQLGDVSLIVICAGTGDLNPALDYSIEEQTNRVNVMGFTQTADWAYNYFSAKGGGHLAAITSIMGLRGSGAAPAYAASKAYQINYLEGLRQRAVQEKRSITITDLRPGSVNTDMMKGEGHFWISTPQQAAQCILRALHRRKAVQYVTPRWKIIAIILKLLPRALYNKM